RSRPRLLRLGDDAGAAPGRDRRGGLPLRRRGIVPRDARAGRVRRVGDGARPPLRHARARAGGGAGRRRRRPARHRHAGRGPGARPLPRGGTDLPRGAVPQGPRAAAARAALRQRAGNRAPPDARARGDRGGQGRVPREGRGRNAEGMSLAGRELILGVTGSIAAYKAVYLLRELTRLGASVTVCLSEHAREFVGALTFRTLSGRPVLTNLFDPQSEDAVEHVALAERADAIVVAPATANLLAKAAHGIADDF